MKKLFCILAVFSAVLVCTFAQETNSSDKRFEITVSDSIGTNIITLANTTKLGVRFSINNDNVGFLLGGYFREGFLIGDIAKGFPVDFYYNGGPYIGIDFWNVEILVGTEYGGEGSFLPYISLGYYWDLIKATSPSSSALNLKLGLEGYADQFKGKYGVQKENAQLSAAIVDMFSLVIPKLTIGVQYSFGWNF